MERRARAEAIVAPLVGGLVVMATLLGLIGTAIRDPKPHDIPVGVAGPAPAVQQLTAGVGTNAPGAFSFTAYASEAAARTALDNRDVDAVLVLGSPPRLVVAPAAGEAITSVITTVFTAVFAAQNAQLQVETTHAYAPGDPHGLVLFFLVLATIISSFVAQIFLYVRGQGAGFGTWLEVQVLWAVLAGLAGVGIAAWIVGGYDIGPAARLASLLALAALAIGAMVGGLTRLLGRVGIGLGGLVMVLLDLISSGGPAGSNFLPDAYRWLSPWMPAGELFSALRGVLYFDSAGIAAPVALLLAYFLIGLLLALIGSAARRIARRPVQAPAPAPAP
jgi:hypothetical protein